MRKFKNLVALGLVVAMISAMNFTALACDFHSSWNLVDSKNKIDWDGKTKYSNEWNRAIQNWNDMGVVKIQKDSISVLQDLNVGDYYDSDDRRIGYCVSNGKIRFNTYHLDTFTNNERQKTVNHELGHALGIDHIPLAGNVMQQGRIDRPHLGILDKTTYQCIWGIIWNSQDNGGE